MSSGRRGRRAERAAQFMPFAALTGYYDLVRRKERVRERRRDPGDEDEARISAELSRVRRGDLVRVVYYQTDAYVTVSGVVTGIDPVRRELSVVRTRIPFDDVWSIDPIPPTRAQGEPYA